MGNISDLRRRAIRILLLAAVCPLFSCEELWERNLVQPAGWWWLTGASEAEVQDRVDQGFRVFDVEVEQASPARFSVSMIRNVGIHENPWGWYFGQTPEEVEDLIDDLNARIIDLEVYFLDGQLRMAVSLIRNSELRERDWWYYYGLEFDEIQEKVDEHNGRIVDLDTYLDGGERRFSIVMVANEGIDEKDWWYYTNLTRDEIVEKLSEHGARLTDIERRGSSRDGDRYAVIMEKSQGELWWWYRGLTMNEVNQRTKQHGARIIDVEPYETSAGKRFLVVLLNNSNGLETRMTALLEGSTDGDYGFYLKRQNGGVRASCRADDPVYPSSTIKVLQHLHTMRRVQAGSVDLDQDTLTKYTNAGESCQDDHTGHTSGVPRTIRAALQEMMVPSDNQSSNALQEFNGFGSAATGRGFFNQTASNVVGMTDDTRINHKFGCGGKSNNPANSMRLDDMGLLYERIGKGELLWTNALGNHRATFYSLMLNETNDRFIDAVIAQEAPEGFNVAAFRAGVRMAHKPGNVAGNVSIAGWVSLPARGGRREFVYGVWIDNFNFSNVSIRNLAAELLRDEIRSAMRSF